MFVGASLTTMCWNSKKNDTARFGQLEKIIKNELGVLGFVQGRDEPPFQITYSIDNDISTFQSNLYNLSGNLHVYVYASRVFVFALSDKNVDKFIQIFIATWFHSHVCLCIQYFAHNYKVLHYYERQKF